MAKFQWDLVIQSVFTYFSLFHYYPQWSKSWFHILNVKIHTFLYHQQKITGQFELAEPEHCILDGIYDLIWELRVKKFHMLELTLPVFVNFSKNCKQYYKKLKKFSNSWNFIHELSLKWTFIKINTMRVDLFIIFKYPPWRLCSMNHRPFVRSPTSSYIFSFRQNQKSVC